MGIEAGLRRGRGLAAFGAVAAAIVVSGCGASTPAVSTEAATGAQQAVPAATVSPTEVTLSDAAFAPPAPAGWHFSHEFRTRGSTGQPVILRFYESDDTPVKDPEGHPASRSFNINLVEVGPTLATASRSGQAANFEQHVLAVNARDSTIESQVTSIAGFPATTVRTVEGWPTNGLTMALNDHQLLAVYSPDLTTAEIEAIAARVVAK